VEVRHDLLRRGVVDRVHARDGRPGAEAEQARDEAQGLVGTDRVHSAGVARGQDHRPGGRGQAVEVVDHERAVGEHQRREERRVGAEGAVCRDVREARAVQGRQHALDRRVGAAQDDRVGMETSQLGGLALLGAEARTRDEGDVAGGARCCAVGTLGRRRDVGPPPQARRG
jgi:hypothetical protein